MPHTSSMIETRNINIQLIELYQQQLAAGKWAAGDRFPSERELAEAHGISRATTNKVISKLVSAGWLESRRGLGTFVAERPTLFSALRQMESFTAFAAGCGLQPSTDVILFKTLSNVNPLLRKQLDPSETDSIIHLRRLRRLNGTAVIHEERWLPSSRYPGLKVADVQGSFYALCLEKYDLHVEREEAVLNATLPPADSEMDEPALCMEGTGFDAKNNPLWKQRLHYHGPCFEIRHTAENLASFPRLSLGIREEFIEHLNNSSSWRNKNGNYS